MTTLHVRTLLVAGAVLAVSACTPVMEPGRCGRFDAPSMGPENRFRVTIPADAAPALDGAPSRIDVAIVSATPLTGPITLVQSAGGREVARWSITPPVSPGIVQRCSLGFAASTCGATLTARPQPAGGEWTVLAGDNRLLEASIAFRPCPAKMGTGPN